MCGINVIFDKKKTISPDLINKMSMATRHRGPDATNTKIIDSYHCNYHIAANRLKITDQSNAAAQPFIKQNEHCALIFNGEIYNYHDLKNDLIKKEVVFNSHSDTEVLFYWIREYGKNRINRLEGMFAFVFIDFQNDEVIIARDRFGIKPIYYYKDEGTIIVSSEIKPIINTGLLSKELNVNQIHHYLLYKYARSPDTFYQGVLELEPGHFIHLNNNIWENEPFVDDKPDVKEEVPNLDKIEELISNSLMQQLESNVPIGLLLSGGIDSTLLLAMAHKEGFTMPTFSIVNSKNDKSFGTEDYHYSKLAASTFQSEHHEMLADISILNQFDEFIANIDQPIGDSSYLMTSAICKNASNSMKVLLSGAGADELFAGYNRHWAYYKYLKNKNILDSIIPKINPIINALPSGFPHPLRKQFRLTKKWSNSHGDSPETTFNNYLTFNTLGINNRFIDKNAAEIDPLEWALQNDLKNYLVNDVLALSDKASMLHGIEMRLPYLNEKLELYLNSYPAKFRLEHGQKWMLKEILIKYGGKKFINRPKEGFGLPLSNWLMDKKVAHLWDIFESDNIMFFEYFDKNRFEKLLTQQKRRVDDHGLILWSMLVLAHWLQRNF